MLDDSLFPFVSSRCRKNHAAFDVGRITSDAGVMLWGKPSVDWRRASSRRRRRSAHPC